MKHLLAAAAIVYSPVALAQVATPAPIPASAPMVAIAPSTPADNVLRAGTKVSLKMAEALTTKGKKLRVGQRFQLETAEDIRLGDMTVIPAGTPATGEVTDVRNKGMWGKSGRIGAQLLYMRVGGRQIRLSGQLDDKGVTGTAGVVGSIALVPIAGFFMTGTSAHIPLGAPVAGFLDEDVPVVANGAATPQPLVVNQPATLTPAAVTTPKP